MSRDTISLTVNGSACTAIPRPGLSLLLYLRGELGLTGPKIGCGGGGCGACTVVVDGVPEQSCLTPLTAVDGAQVQTVEALVQDGIGQAVASALIEAGAAQCGYCLPGIVTAASAALARDGAKTDIDAALSRNLCRCGTHHRILTALRQVRDQIAEDQP